MSRVCKAGRSPGSWVCTAAMASRISPALVLDRDSYGGGRPWPPPAFPGQRAQLLYGTTGTGSSGPRGRCPRPAATRPHSAGPQDQAAGSTRCSPSHGLPVTIRRSPLSCVFQTSQRNFKEKKKTKTLLAAHETSWWKPPMAFQGGGLNFPPSGV